MPIIIERPDRTGSTRSAALRIGAGLAFTNDADGIPTIDAAPGSGGGAAGNETVVAPRGGGLDDAANIAAALYQGRPVRLAAGDFTLAQTVYLPPGASLAGSGAGSGADGVARTRVVKQPFAGPAFVLTGSADVTVAGMRIAGPGRTVAGSGSAILAATGGGWATRVALRDLVIEEFAELGILIQNATRVTIADVRCSAIGDAAVALEHVGAALVAGVAAEGCGKGVRLVDVGGSHVAACHVDGANEAYLVDACSGVVLDACVSRRCTWRPLHVRGGWSSVINAFHSSNDGIVQPDAPHLLVTAGGSEITINGFTFVHGSGALPYADADVELAGGPIRVASHNFTAPRIRSAGRFAEPAYTVIP